MQQVRSKLIGIIVDKLNVSLDEIQDNTKIATDLGADSLDMIELIMEMESQFDITIPDDEAEELETFKNCVDYIEQKIKPE